MTETTQNIYESDLEEEMKDSYLDYSMSVIVSRALPDVRDGMKPVHRRILYGMQGLGLTPDKPYRKSARLVGEVMGKYHPHGDSAIYEAVVRLAQDFSTRYPLADGQGNFGSVDGDGAAAMRYTEVRMTRLALEMLRDINKDTVDFQPNFDETEKEPTVLPSRFPNLIVNGSSGIAVGMATSMPPHNLNETIDACISYIRDPEISISGLMEYIKGPDFPTGGKIMGYSAINQAYRTGRGKIKMRASYEIEEYKNRNRLVFTEIPYQVNKSRLVKSIADNVKEKKLEGISDLRDESDRKGMRIVVELKRDANPEIVLNNLFKQTQLETTFGIINLCLVNGEPRVLNLKELISYYIDHQVEVITRRTEYDLKRALDREHIVEGLLVAIDNIEEIIKIIRSNYDEDTIKKEFHERFDLTDKQSQAILDMQLRRLSGLQKEKLDQEYEELKEKIKYYREILADRSVLNQLLIDELLEIREKFGDERRTEILPAQESFEDEDLIEEEDVLVTLSYKGYIKRLPTDTYKVQKRGGKGIIGMNTGDGDFVKNMINSNTHTDILFFSQKGKCYNKRVWQIQEASRQSKGQHIANLLELERGEKVTAMMDVTDPKEEDFLILLTKKGLIKKTPLIQFKNVRRNGLISISFREEDSLIGVKATSDDDQIMVTTKKGKAIRFDMTDIRKTGRTSMGVKAIDLDEDDECLSLQLVSEGKKLLTVSEKGYGKLTDLDEFKVQKRGGKGLICYKLLEKTGYLADTEIINEDEDILMVTNNGDIIRLEASDISSYGRNTSGVKLKNMKDRDEKIVSIEKYLED